MQQKTPARYCNRAIKEKTGETKADEKNKCFITGGTAASRVIDAGLPQRTRWGFELIACAATSCSKQPHAEVQKVRRADSEIDGAVKARVSWGSRCCYNCVTDMLNPRRKHLGCCCSCTDCLTGLTRAGSQLSPLRWGVYFLMIHVVRFTAPILRVNSTASSHYWRGLITTGHHYERHVQL